LLYFPFFAMLSQISVAAILSGWAGDMSCVGTLKTGRGVSAREKQRMWLCIAPVGLNAVIA
jgi:hypothetical protein